MNPREEEIAAFLAEAGFADAEQFPVAADFSPRRYVRLVRGDNTRAILMDADQDQKTFEFTAMAGLLRDLDISAPEIFAADIDRGLALMEDFGGGNFGARIDAGADLLPLYLRAADLLAHLHRNFTRESAGELDLPLFGGALYAAQAEFFLDYWFPHAKKREATRDEGEGFRATWKEALRGIEALPQSLTLRDFMPDNLMDLPQRAAWRSVGVLDFQDGGLGPIAYDLASLCEAVRRDGGDALLDPVLDHYCALAKPALGKKELRAACRILAAQRHVRVLGVIARLAAREKRPEKLVYAPRIWTYLGRLLGDEALRPVGAWMKQNGFTA